MSELKPCPICGSTNITCYAEYEGDSYDNEPVYRAVVACLGCHEEGCCEDYDEEPCFGIEAYFPQRHQLIKDIEDPSDCERVLERHMAERWNRRAERTCHIVPMDAAGEPPYRTGDWIYNMMSDGCSECGYPFNTARYGEPNYCPHCGARVVSDD